MVHTHFGSDFLFGKRSIVEQFHFASRRDVKNVKTGIAFVGKFDSACSANIAGFGATHKRVEEYRQVVAKSFAIKCFIAVDDGFVLAVDSNDRRNLAEDAAKSVLVVDEHVASR